MKNPFAGEFNKTQGYGENPEAYAKFGLKGHNGLDWGMPEGTDLLSPIKGNVTEVGWDASGYGLYMKVENDTEGCILAHLKENLLAIGAEVAESQLIAKSGNTGNSTGPHLHLGYFLKPRNRNNGYGGYIDPSPYLPGFVPHITIEQSLYEVLVTNSTAYDNICGYFELQKNLGWDKMHDHLVAMNNGCEQLKNRIQELTEENRKLIEEKMAAKPQDPTPTQDNTGSIQALPPDAQPEEKPSVEIVNDTNIPNFMDALIYYIKRIFIVHKGEIHHEQN